MRSCPTDNVYGRSAARAPVARAPAATPPCSCVCRESGERPRTRRQGCRPQLPPECVGRVGAGRVRRLLAYAPGRAGPSCRRRVRRAHAWEVQDGGGGAARCQCTGHASPSVPFIARRPALAPAHRGPTRADPCGRCPSPRSRPPPSPSLPVTRCIPTPQRTTWSSSYGSTDWYGGPPLLAPALRSIPTSGARCWSP